MKEKPRKSKMQEWDDAISRGDVPAAALAATEDYCEGMMELMSSQKPTEIATGVAMALTSPGGLPTAALIGALSVKMRKG